MAYVWRANASRHTKQVGHVTPPALRYSCFEHVPSKALTYIVGNGSGAAIDIQRDRKTVHDSRPAKRHPHLQSQRASRARRASPGTEAHLEGACGGEAITGILCALRGHRSLAAVCDVGLFVCVDLTPQRIREQVGHGMGCNGSNLFSPRLQGSRRPLRWYIAQERVSIAASNEGIELVFLYSSRCINVKLCL